MIKRDFASRRSAKLPTSPTCLTGLDGNFRRPSKSMDFVYVRLGNIDSPIIRGRVNSEITWEDDGAHDHIDRRPSPKSLGYIWRHVTTSSSKLSRIRKQIDGSAVACTNNALRVKTKMGLSIDSRQLFYRSRYGCFRKTSSNTFKMNDLQSNLAVA